MTDKSARILSSELLAKRWGSLTAYRLQYSRPDGGTEEMTREIYDRGHASVVLLHDPDTDSVLLVRQVRPAPLVNRDNPYMLEACAGLLDGNTPEECARREALEEAGVDLTSLRPVTSTYSNPAALTEVLHVFIGEYRTQQRIHAGGGLADEGEHLEVVKMPFDRAYGMIASGQITDMKTIVALQALMIERLR